jgi:uncharacterized membrane protein required for colicin V production
VDIIGFITSVKAVDLLVFFAFFGLFILGYVQGIIRRLLGIASILISLLVAAQLRTPVGAFLSNNWTQYSSEYDHMIAFGSIFLAGTIASTIALQLFFKPLPLFAKYPVVDEVLGGLLGLLQGALILAAFYLITDPFFTTAGQHAQTNEFPFIRQIHDVLQGSVTADIVRQDLVPSVLFFFGAIFPADVTAVFRR